MFCRATMAALLVAASLSSPAPALAESWSSPEEARAEIERCFGANPNGEARCLDAVVDECLDIPANQTTAGMVQCSSIALEGWDLLLNSTYQSVMSYADDGVKTALRSAQRSWIAYRDAKCAVWLSLYEGGSMGRLLGADCMRDETARRALDLREIAAHQAL